MEINKVQIYDLFTRPLNPPSENLETGLNHAFESFEIGYDMTLFDAAFFKLLLKFTQSKGEPMLDIPPIQLADIYNKQLIEVWKN